MAIDRRALVRRHEVRLTGIDALSPLSVGNGEFAFSADVTGLQSWPGEYVGERKIPLCTMAQWGWHSFPAPAGMKALRLEGHAYAGRKLELATDATGQKETFDYLRENPHRLHLGVVGLKFGPEVAAGDLKNIDARLDLWEGVIRSSFEVDGVKVLVQTASIGDRDGIAVRVVSAGLASGRVKVRLAFPYGSPAECAADWGKPGAHSSCVETETGSSVLIRRQLDGDTYAACLRWNGEAKFARVGEHEFELSTSAGEIEFVMMFAAKVSPEVPGFEQAWRAGRLWWEKYWNEGAAVDFSGCTDERAPELERRVVLSQYLMAVNCAGSLPPAETGLTCNSWYGKFHLEMHWWHGVHWASWGRIHLLEKSLDWYREVLPVARRRAREQGFARGARWAKMTSREEEDAPSPVGPLIVWQQPHPIYYAELLYRERPGRETLDAWREMVFETADWMAEFATLPGGRFAIGPPVKTVSENTPAETAVNPAFEVAYWKAALSWAQRWRERLGLGREPRWQAVIEGLPALPQAEGVYFLQEGMTDTYSKWNWEHPAVMGVCGMLPGDGVDAGVFRRTVEQVSAVWQWDRCWGWDFPLCAMAAARAGLPELAVEHLLRASVKNAYSAAGHNFQRPGLALYLPGNGGLLAAVGMMAGGWEGSGERKTPGFPATGWDVRAEGLRRWM